MLPKLGIEKDLRCLPSGKWKEFVSKLNLKAPMFIDTHAAATSLDYVLNRLEHKLRLS